LCETQAFGPGQTGKFGRANIFSVGHAMETGLASRIEVAMPAGEIDQLQVNPVDLKHLRRFTLGDRALEKEVLELFLGQLPETISSLRRAATEKDWRVAAHTLKGSGRAVGAWRIARLAEHAERMLGVKHTETRVEALARIEDAAREAQAFIFATYGPRPV
jgi:HPt (histidine-containing phosphotransfer) domain-containing protein